jgi:hypothetical protein
MNGIAYFGHRRLREYNDCNLPKGQDGGRFGANSDPRCGAKGTASPAPKAYVRPTPIKTDDIAEAIDHILAGRVVELTNVRAVGTVLSRLAKMALDARERGEKAPNYDLCNVSVKGSNIFCTEKLRTPEHPNGVPRIKMPQLGGEPVPGSRADALPRKSGKTTINGSEAFVGHLKELGIKTTRATVPAAHLKASQAELVGPKVASMMVSDKDLGSEPIFISRDNYVIDGHHRWAAQVGRDALDGVLGDVPMAVIRVDAPVSEVLRLANKWSRDFGIQTKAAREVAVRLREFNDCNLPAGERDGGRFGSNSDPRCGDSRTPGQRPYRAADAASPERSIYGARALDDDAAFAYSAEDQLPQTKAFDARRLDGAEVKQEIATALGKQLLDHATPEQVNALYKDMEDRILQVVRTLGEQGELSSNLQGIERFAKVDKAPNPDAPNVRRNYEAMLDSVHEGERNQAFNQATRYFVHEVPLHDAPDGSGRSALGSVTEPLLAWLNGAANFGTDEHSDDVSESVQFELRRRLAYNEDFKAYAIEAVHKRVGLENNPDFSAHFDKLAPVFAEVEAAINNIPGLSQDSLFAGVRAFSFDLLKTIKKDVTGESIGKAMTAGAQARADSRRAEHADYGFDKWYEDAHGVTPQQFHAWREAAGRDQLPASVQAEALATVFIKQWAVSSGDDHRDSIALQMATGAEFGLPSAYTGRLVKRGDEETRSLQDAQKLYADHGPALRGFVRGMYEHTQKQLDDLYPDSDHITLFRGFEMPLQQPAAHVVKFLGPPPGGFKRDAGAYAINPQGSLVDVNLQPASSFSLSAQTAGAFGGNFFTVRVPKARILSTALTGFGCLSETEMVVLGGRATGIVSSSDEIRMRATGPVMDLPDYRRAHTLSVAAGLGSEAFQSQLLARGVSEYAERIARAQRRAMGFYEKGKS